MEAGQRCGLEIRNRHAQCAGRPRYRPAKHITSGNTGVLGGGGLLSQGPSCAWIAFCICFTRQCVCALCASSERQEGVFPQASTRWEEIVSPLASSQHSSARIRTLTAPIVLPHWTNGSHPKHREQDANASLSCSATPREGGGPFIQGAS